MATRWHCCPANGEVSAGPAFPAFLGAKLLWALCAFSPGPQRRLQLFPRPHPWGSVCRTGSPMRDPSAQPRYNPRRGNRKLLSWDPVFFTEYSSHMSQHIHSSDHSFPITRRGNEQDRHQIYLRHLTVKAETEGGLWNWVKLGAGYWYHLYLDTKFGIV